MNLRDVLHEELILLNLDCKDKEQVLQTMADSLYSNHYISNSLGFLEDVYRREDLGATGIGNYIAIPHGQSDYVEKTTLCIATLKNEINWETLDGKGVKVVIMFAVENKSSFADDHLKLLAEVAKKLAKEETLLKLSNSTTEEEIVDCFK